MHPARQVDPATNIEGRGYVWSSLDGALAGISKAQWHFGHGLIDRSPMATMLKGWEDNYQADLSLHDEAPAFDVIEDMPKIHDGVMKVPGLSDDERRELWMMVLVDMNSLGRASDVTGDYCPALGDVKFSKKLGTYLDDSHPSEAEIVFRKWKHRKSNTAYPLLVQSNQIDARYCVVFWIMYHIGCLKKSGRYNKENRLWDLASTDYQRVLKKIFIWIADETGDDYFRYMSSHSIRRTAARWARRCGADDRVLLDVGRWKDWNQLKTYLGEGDDDIELDDDGKDPILKFWVFKTKATKAWQEAGAGTTSRHRRRHTQ